MSGIYVFYITTDKQLVDSSPSVYDEMLLEGNRVAWVRTERYSKPFPTLDDAAAGNEPRPGEHFLGVVEL